MQKQRLTAYALTAIMTAGAIVPAAAQVRGYSAIDLQPSVQADAYTSSRSAAQPVYDERYDDQYDARYDDRYYDERYDQPARYDDAYDPYYDDPYYDGYRQAPPPRRGDVYYPREDRTGEVVAGVIVGALIGYAIAESNDDDHHRHYRYDRRRDRHYHDRRRRHRR